MLYDPDEGLKKSEELEDMDKLLSALQDCDLGDWDIDFVNDLTDKREKFAERMHITGKQWEQLERMRKQYNVSV